MNFKSIFIVILAICVLFGMSCACADDLNDTEMAATDISDNLKQSDIEDIVAEIDDGTFTALQHKIDNAEKESTITLENDYAYDEGFDVEGIVINKSLTINGNGHKFDGKSKSKVFQITNTISGEITVSLKNITFVNANGAIRAVTMMRTPNDLTVEYCIFENNTDSAISCLGVDLHARNSLFSNNQALESGGAIYGNDDHSVYYCGNKLTIEDCVFENNKASNYGGAIRNFYSGFHVENCIFTNNQANYGGAISNTGSGSVENCEFKNNRAKQSGGAIYLAPSISDYNRISGTYSIEHYYDVVRNSNFTKNQAKSGGAILVQPSTYDYQEDVDVKNCIFDDNRADEGSEVSGAKITDCLFKKTSLSVSKVTATYGVSKNLVVTLKDSSGHALKSEKVKIKVGSISKTLTTNNRGQVSVDVSNLNPNTYTASISYAGDDKHYKSDKSIKVTVKKSGSKFVAKKKTFKLKAKSKKYTIDLKTSKGKAIKKAKVRLTVVGKTYKKYKATTNKKGKATFNLKKLTKKGTFYVYLQFSGNKYYKETEKVLKISVKK